MGERIYAFSHNLGNNKQLRHIILTIADINTEIRAICDADSTSLTNATLLYRVNNAYEEIVGKIIAESAGSDWKFGDANYSAFPSYTLNLVAGTAAYQIDALASGTYPDSYEPLIIIGVEILNDEGNYYPIKPISLKEIHETGIAQSEFLETNGAPLYFEKREHMVVLYPAPAAADVTTTNGLKIFYLRTADRFTSSEVTTGTKEPGFASPYHILIVYKAAIPYCLSYKKDRVPFLMSEIARLEKDMLAFYARRDQTVTPKLTMKRVMHR